MEPNDLIMVFDTETTGKSDFKASYNAPQQPNLVQLGYKVYDRDANVIFEIGHLVNSTTMKEWNGIEPEAEAIHKVSQQSIEKYGTSIEGTFKAFSSWAKRCNLFVAHNAPFDVNVMQCFAFRQGASPDLFSHGNIFCTMNNTTNICKIPNVGRGGFKWPKLDEAYRFFINEKGFGNAHNALADVNAAGEVFWHLKKAGLVPIHL